MSDWACGGDGKERVRSEEFEIVDTIARVRELRFVAGDRDRDGDVDGNGTRSRRFEGFALLCFVFLCFPCRVLCGCVVCCVCVCVGFFVTELP